MYNEFELMCKRLDKCNKGCVANKYICAERAVKEYVSDDKKKLLQLKAQAKSGDFYAYSAFVLAIAALIIACVDNVLGAIPGFENMVTLVATIKILMIVAPTLFYIFRLMKFAEVLKWRHYILEALSELEKNKFCTK